jgi:pSer/pThr/pTyr-binding forkhead associated (FHA) protein
VPGSTVSRRHARIFREDAGVWIEALGGDEVRVNGEAVRRVRLTNRDHIQVGALEVEFFEG